MSNLVVHIFQSCGFINTVKKALLWAVFLFMQDGICLDKTIVPNELVTEQNSPTELVKIFQQPRDAVVKIPESENSRIKREQLLALESCEEFLFDLPKSEQTESSITIENGTTRQVIILKSNQRYNLSQSLRLTGSALVVICGDVEDKSNPDERPVIRVSGPSKINPDATLNGNVVCYIDKISVEEEATLYLVNVVLDAYSWRSLSALIAVKQWGQVHLIQSGVFRYYRERSGDYYITALIYLGSHSDNGAVPTLTMRGSFSTLYDIQSDIYAREGNITITDGLLVSGTQPINDNDVATVDTTNTVTAICGNLRRTPVFNRDRLQFIYANIFFRFDRNNCGAYINSVQEGDNSNSNPDNNSDNNIANNAKGLLGSALDTMLLIGAGIITSVILQPDINL